MRKLRSIAATVLLLALATPMALGFQRDAPSGKSYFGEQSQAQVEEQTKLQGTIPVVGSGALDSTRETAQGSLGSDESGDSFNNAKSAKDKASFNAASKTIAENGGAKPWWAMLFMVVGVILIAVIGFKSYADKIAPVPENIRS